MAKKRPVWDPPELRTALLDFAANGPSDEVTVEDALRALILEVGKYWPELLSAEGLIDVRDPITGDKQNITVPE